MSQFITSRTFDGGSGSQSLDIRLPYPEKVDVYTIKNSNATKWKLEGTNDNGVTWTQLDTQSFQHKLKPVYTCSNPGTFSNYRFTFLQSSRNYSNVYVNEIRLQNVLYQNITPNLNAVSNTYTCVLTSGLDTVAPVFGVGITSVVNGPTLIGRQYLQSNMYANVVCGHVRVTKPFEALVGSIDNGLTWSNVLVYGSNVSSNLSPFNSFRMVGSDLINTTFEMYDPDGNILNSNDPNQGGAYKGAGPGEYIDLSFDTRITANVYEFTTTGTKFPTAWSVYGSNDSGSSWTLLDKKSNVYDSYTRFTWPFAQGVIPYLRYRFIINAFKGRSSAEIVSFNIFDDRGYRLIPALSKTSQTIDKVNRPHNVYESPISTSPGTSSPFIDGKVFTSTSSDGQFAISFPTAVSVHKIYMETNTPSFSVYGSQTDSYTSLIANITQLVPSNVYPTSNTYCFRNFLFRGIGINCFVSNVALFNSNGGRINPYMSSSSIVSSNTFGGPVYGSPISIQIDSPVSAYANAYAFRLDNQSLAKWSIQSNIDGTWTTIESTSNAYAFKNPYFQNTFTRHKTTGMRILVNEINPSKEIGDFLKIFNFNVLGNTYSSIIPSTALNPVTKYTVQSFTTVGTTSLIVSKTTRCDILIVAGGGAGGNRDNGNGQGGGGGGGVLYLQNVTLAPGTYSITVGSGGVPGVNYGDGGNSSFDTLGTAIGGGAASSGVGSGRPGGSGGGSTWNNPGGAGTPGQGYAGGRGYSGGVYGTGGGGGAGGPGGDATSSKSGNGGPGILNSITGTPTYYAGGGGGGVFSGSPSGNGIGGIGGGGDANTSGVNGTGGGGGGPGRDTQITGSGGSGIVIVRIYSDIDNLPLKSSMQGEFKIQSSRVMPTYRLFDQKFDTEFSMDMSTPQPGGEWVEVQTPFPTRIKYFTFTVPNNPSETPTQWMLLGSNNYGVTWSNVLSNQNTDYYTSIPAIQQTNVFTVTNTTDEFTNFRFVYKKAVNASSTLHTLKDLSFYGPTARIVPTYKQTNAAPSISYTWNTYVDPSGDVYGGVYTGQGTTTTFGGVIIPGDWIQLKFPTLVYPYYIRLAGIIPKNVFVVVSNDRFVSSSYIAGSLQNNFSTTSTQVTIPISGMFAYGSAFQYFRIIASDVESANCTFKLNEVSFLNDRMNKIHQSFTVDTGSTDPNNQLYDVTQPNELGGRYQTSPQYIEANVYPQAASSNSYIFRSIDAREWNVEASSDYTTWDVIDTRTLDTQISLLQPQAQILYYNKQTGNAYSWYRMNIISTFKTTDGCTRITEFSPIDYKMDRVIKYTNGNAYTGGTYTGLAYLQTRNKNYYGEYKTFQFEKPVPISNATLTFDKSASIKGITFLGKNDEQYWNVIPVVGAYGDIQSECIDKTLVGTYIFSGTTESNPSNAFTTSPYCVFGRTINPDKTVANSPYIQIDLPRPTPIGSYEISIPSILDFTDFALPSSWVVQGSNDNGVTWTTLNTVSNDIYLTYNSSYRYYITNSSPYKIIRFTFQKTNSLYTALIKQFILYDTNGYPLFQPKIFTRDLLVQNIERAPLYMGPVKKFEFTNQVLYSNIAYVINNFTNDPYKSSGQLQITATDFEPTRFVGGTSNYTLQYSYNPTDVVYGNSQSVVFYTESGRTITPTNYYFDSRTTNLWSFYSSMDGKDWNLISRNDKNIQNPSPGSWFKLTVDAISNLTDGTVDISNVHINESSIITWPSTNMVTNSLFSKTPLQSDTFKVFNAKPSVSSSS